MSFRSAMFACTVVALALGACASSPDRTSGSFASSGTAKSSMSAMPAQATLSGAGGAAAGGGGQAENNVNGRAQK